MRFIVGPTLLCFFVMLAGCQKEIEGDASAGNLQEDSSYLSKIYMLDVGAAPGVVDTVSVVILQYDSLKRVKEIDGTSYVNQLPDAASTRRSRMLYHGTDTLCYQSFDVDAGGNLMGNTNYYSYGSNGKLLTDSVASPDHSYNVTKCIPVAGGIKYITLDFFVQSGSLFADTVFLWQTISNGHIVTEREDDLVNPPIVTDFEYDAHINPWKKTNLFCEPSFFYQLQLVYQCTDKNNVTKQTYNPGVGPGITNLYYNYREDGLPISAIISDINTPANNTAHYYVYTAL